MILEELREAVELLLVGGRERLVGFGRALTAVEGVVRATVGRGGVNLPGVSAIVVSLTAILGVTFPFAFAGRGFVGGRVRRLLVLLGFLDRRGGLRFLGKLFLKLVLFERGLLLDLGLFLKVDGVDDLDRSLRRGFLIGGLNPLVVVGPIGFLGVADRQPVVDHVPRLDAQAGRVDLDRRLEYARRFLAVREILGQEDLIPLIDMEDGVADAVIVGGGDEEGNLDVDRDLGRRFLGLQEGDVGRGLVGDGPDVVLHGLGVDLPLGGREADPIASRLIDVETSNQLVLSLTRDIHRDLHNPLGLAVLSFGDGPRRVGRREDRPAVILEDEKRRLRRLIRGRVNRDLGPLERFHCPARDGGGRGQPGVGRGERVVRDIRDHRGAEHLDVVVQRLRVAAGQIVVKALPDLPHRQGPGIVVIRSRTERRGRVKVAAVDAPVKQDLFGTRPLQFDRERNIQAGNHLGKLGIVSRLDVNEQCVGRPDDVGQKGALGGVEDALGRERGIEAEDHHDAGEGVEHPQENLLADHGVDLNLGQILDRLFLHHRHDRLGEFLAMLAQVEIVDQAILERRVGPLNGSRGVKMVNLAEQGTHDPQRKERQRRGTAAPENHPPQPDRQAEEVIEHDLKEQHPNHRRDEDQDRCINIGHLDPGLRPIELILDVLFVIENLAGGLRSYCHRSVLQRSLTAVRVPCLPLADF